ERDVLRLEQRRDMLLQLQRKPRVAKQDARPGAVRAELPHGLDAGGGDAWVSSEPEIVLRREVDAVACGCGKVGNGGVRARRLLEGKRVGPQPVFRPAADVVVEPLGALEEIGPG